MKRMTLPVLLMVAAMLALTACGNKRNGPAETDFHNESGGNGMGM